MSVEPYPVQLRVNAPDISGYVHVELSDARGNTAADRVAIDLTRPLEAEGEGTWQSFLEDYRSDKYTPSLNDLAAFGSSLFAWLITETRLQVAWQGIRSSRAGRPLDLTMFFGAGTHRMAALPWELLRVGASWEFQAPRASLTRAYLEVPASRIGPLPEAKVLLAWACPEGATPFDPLPHVDALHEALPQFSPDHDVLGRATLPALAERLRTGGYHVLHLLCHGFADPSVSGVVLHGLGRGAALVPAHDLAAALVGTGLRGAFLCACKSAVGSNFTGTGQHLLASTGLAWAVATQGNLAVRGSDRLAGLFYRRLYGGVDPDIALFEARRAAYEGTHYWSVPIFLGRPEAEARSTEPRDAPTLPDARATFLDRPELIPHIVEALGQHRLVSVVGLPGIGKTEVGLAAARRAAPRHDVVHLFEARQGTTPELLCAEVAIHVLGLQTPPSSAKALAQGLQRAGRVLLVVDNAEDLMRNTADRQAFAQLLEALLRWAPDLTVLLTTRWMAETDEPVEHVVRVPPLTSAQTEALWRRELDQRLAVPETWPGSEAWQRLLAFIDGHPRTLALVASQLHRRTSLPDIAQRLESQKIDAVVHRSLYGMDDAEVALAGDDSRANAQPGGVDGRIVYHPGRHEAFGGRALLRPVDLPQRAAVRRGAGAWGSARPRSTLRPQPDAPGCRAALCVSCAPAGLWSPPRRSLGHRRTRVAHAFGAALGPLRRRVPYPRGVRRLPGRGGRAAGRGSAAGAGGRRGAGPSPRRLVRSAFRGAGRGPASSAGRPGALGLAPDRIWIAARPPRRRSRLRGALPSEPGGPAAAHR